MTKILCQWVICCYTVLFSQTAEAGTMPLRAQPGNSSRWLKVANVKGETTYSKARQEQRPAHIGDRLQLPGDQLSTLASGSAELHLDDGIAKISIGNLTTVTIQNLEKRADGGKVTNLQIEGGQCLLKLRPLNHPHSSVTISTPAAIAGVRGTVFGISANGQGLSAIATRQGKVIVTGQGKSVAVHAWEQSLAVPGQPPTSPRPLVQNAYLFDVKLAWVNAEQVRLQANTDPGNLVRVSGVPLDIGINGRIETTATVTPDLRVIVEITTPLGQQKIFPLTVLLSEKPKV
ncbi:MAG: FecR domain-containing protein [Anaerolineae bacterium]|nr:FecR domain-containing protein [Gloeobacterales cyanobacterium ES-bin-313]